MSGSFGVGLEEWPLLKEVVTQDFSASVGLNSAYAVHKHQCRMEALQAAVREKAERERKAAEATIELNSVLKKQNELLLAQLKESNDARAAAEKQAREERVWKWVMFVITLISIVVAVVF